MWQEIAALMMVAVATAWSLWRGWQMVRPRSSGCGGHCGCGSKAQESKGEPPKGELMVRSSDLLARLEMRRGGRVS